MGRTGNDSSSLITIPVVIFSLLQDRRFLFLYEERIFTYRATFFSSRFHDRGDRQTECLQTYQASRTHEQGCPGVRKDEHSDNFVRWQTKESSEDKQTNGFIAAYLSGGSWEDIEHVVESISEDSCPKGNGEANSPEGEHSGEAIADNG